MSKASYHQVRTDLQYLVEAWPSLVALKIPGTARAWAERPRTSRTLSPEDLERLGPKGVPRPAPADIGVLDLIYTLATKADDIARTLVDVAYSGDVYVVGDWPPQRILPDEEASKDPRPWLEAVSFCLEPAHRADDKTLPWVAYEIGPIVRQSARLLGDIRDGQVLNGICPWCNGRGLSDVHGERTMEIHYPDPDDETDEPLIVCRGVNCSPPRTMCGMRWHDHPAWTRREWDWLAKMLRDPEHEIERAG